MPQSWLFRVIDFRPYPHIEISLYVMIIYVPFIVAEVLSMSGIVTILFTGIICKCYAHRSLTAESKVLADGMFRILAHLAETVIFLELGMAVFGMSSAGNFHTIFILISLGACLVGRFLNIYPLSFLLNTFCYGGDGGAKIKANTQHMLMYSGLRGAVAFACATTFPDVNGNKDLFIVTTMTIVLVTVFVLGGGTETALSALNIPVDVDENQFDDAEVPKMKPWASWSAASSYMERKFELAFIREGERLPSGAEKMTVLVEGGGAAGGEGGLEMTGVEGSHNSGSLRKGKKKSNEDDDTVSLVEAGKNGGGGAKKKKRTVVKKTESSLFDTGGAKNF